MRTSRGGCNTVSHYQRMCIKAVIENGTRSQAAEELGIPQRTLDDSLGRAFKALKVNNISDAYYLVMNGVRSRADSKEIIDK